jgi:hypothetical protein
MTKTMEQAETEFTRGINTIGLSHRMNVADQLDRQARHNETLRQQANGDAVSGTGAEEGDEVGSRLTIDSPTTVNHYHKPEGEGTRKKAGTMAKLALGAGLIATGAGSFAGFSLVADALKDTTEKTEQVKPMAKSVAPDSDTRYSLDLGD